MKKEVLNHIKNEKDISRYKIRLLQERSSAKKYKHRLISIEREFLEYPFEEMLFSNIGEARSAISLFKTSRSSFNNLYVASGNDEDVGHLNLSVLKEKVSFFEKKYENLLDKRLKKINIFEDKFFIKADPKNKDRSLAAVIGPDAAAKIEGAFTAKKRARVQVSVYCLARFIYYKVQSAKKIINSDDPAVFDLKVCEKELDNMFDNFEKLIFRHYNDGIKEVPLLTNGTLGHNKYLPSVYPLANLLDSHEDGLFFQRVLGPEVNFFSDDTYRPIRKKFVKRGFSVVTNIKRVGNEVIDILYSDIWSESKNCLNKIVSNSFYNILYDGVYYKSISTIPAWDILKELRKNKSLAEDFIKLLGLCNTITVEELLSSDAAFAECVNSSEGGRLFVSPESSEILVPITRSEAGHIKESLAYIDLLITEIKDEYNKAMAS